MIEFSTSNRATENVAKDKVNHGWNWNNVLALMFRVYDSSTGDVLFYEQFNKLSHSSHEISIRFCCHFREKEESYKGEPSLP